MSDAARAVVKELIAEYGGSPTDRAWEEVLDAFAAEQTARADTRLTTRIEADRLHMENLRRQLATERARADAAEAQVERLRALAAEQMEYIIHTHDESHDEEPSDDCRTCDLVHKSVALLAVQGVVPR